MDISLSELSEVKGIGKKTIERVKEYKNYKENLKQDRDVNLQVNELETDVIYNTDNIKGMRQLIPDNSIDLTVTSPPYDNLRDYEDYDFNFESVAKELYRVTKEGGVVVWVVGDGTENASETGNSFRQALYFKEIGFNLHDTMIYQKNSYPFPPSNRYYQVFEYMFVFSKSKPQTTNLLTQKTKWRKNTNELSTYRDKDGQTIEMKYEKGKKERIKDNVWKLNTGYMRTTKDKFAYKHPAMFPEKLVEDHIKSWTNKCDVVLDPFMGSGTTAKMAKKLNRKYVGFEVSKKYCNIIEQRLAGD